MVIYSICSNCIINVMVICSLSSNEIVEFCITAVWLLSLGIQFSRHCF